MTNINIIITSGYYSSHGMEGLLTIPKKDFPKLRKAVKSLVEDLETRTPIEYRDDWYGWQKAHEIEALAKIGVFEKRPTKLEVLFRILDNLKIVYTFEACDEINLGDYWGEYDIS